MYKRLRNSSRQIDWNFFFLESNGLYKIDGTKVDHFNESYY